MGHHQNQGLIEYCICHMRTYTYTLIYIHAWTQIYTHAQRHMYALGVKQYGSSPYCILPSSVLQYIAILQYD